MILKSQNNAIILVQEITKGMKSVGSKALLELYKNTSVLEYQIQYLKRFYYPINIYVCTGFEHEKIVKTTQKYKNVYYSFNREYETDNQVGSLIKCLKEYDNIKNALVFSNGLIPIDKIKINRNESSIQVTDKPSKIPFQIGTNNNSDLSYLFYGLPYKWTEFIYLNKDSINQTIELTGKKNYCKMFLFELINILLDHGLKIKIEHTQKNTPIKINNIKDLGIAKKYYEKHLYHKIK